MQDAKAGVEALRDATNEGQGEDVGSNTTWRMEEKREELIERQPMYSQAKIRLMAQQIVGSR